MFRKPTVLIVLLTTAAIPLFLSPREVSAVPPNPTSFTLLAGLSGFNGTDPTLTEFRAVTFNAKIVWTSLQHDFAVYTKGFPAVSVSTSNVCQFNNTFGCLKASRIVTMTVQTANLTFTPNIPPDDFLGVGTYEYYCQFHPSTMAWKVYNLQESRH